MSNCTTSVMNHRTVDMIHDEEGILSTCCIVSAETDPSSELLCNLCCAWAEIEAGETTEDLR